MSKRFHTGSHDLPVTPALEDFMREGCLDSSGGRADPVAGYAATRRQALRHALPGERLMIRSGELKQRSTTSTTGPAPFGLRVLTGHSSDGVLVLEPTAGHAIPAPALVAPDGVLP